MPLPFKNPSKPQIHVISDPVKGDLEFEILGSVTLEEELEIIEIWKPLEAEQGKYKAPTAETMQRVTWGVATLALRRLDPSWTQNDTKKLPVALVNACSTFLLKERRQWTEPDPEAVKKLLSTGKSTSEPLEKTTPPPTTDLQQPGPETPDGTPTDSPKTPSPKSKKQA